MAVTLITGVPRSGKTLYSMSLIAEAVKKKRAVYTDIDGIDFDGVEFYKEDWRDLPDGSLVVFDEVHKRWPAAGKSGMSSDPTCSDLDEHGHRGFDFLIITQWPTKVHFEARTNVSTHTHVCRIANTQSATLYTWNAANTAPDRRDQKDIADSEPFLYPKKLYEKYKSATLHNAKVKIPKKIYFYATLLLIVFGFMGRLIAGGGTILTTGQFAGSTTDPIPKIIQQHTASGRTSVPAAVVSTRILLSGCIASKSACLCYSDEGEVMNYHDAVCRNILEKPLPFPLRIEDS